MGPPPKPTSRSYRMTVAGMLAWSVGCLFVAMVMAQSRRPALGADDMLVLWLVGACIIGMFMVVFRRADTRPPGA